MHMKNIAKGKEKEASLAIIAEMKDAFDKAGQEAQPLADSKFVLTACAP